MDKVGFTGSTTVGKGDRGPLRPTPAISLPGARRQEPARRHARRGPRPRRRRCPLLRFSAPPASAAPPSARSSSTRRSTTSSSPRYTKAVEEGGYRRSNARRPLRPDAKRTLRRAVRGLAGVGARPPHPPRLYRHRAHNRRQPRARVSSGMPRPASTATQPSWMALWPKTKSSTPRPSAR